MKSLETLVAKSLKIFWDANLKKRNEIVNPTENINFFTDSVPIKFGFMIFVMHATAVSYKIFGNWVHWFYDLFLFPNQGAFTGAAVNPARTFAPALYNLEWTNQWLYWLAPFSAAASGSLFYKYFFAKDYTEIPQNWTRARIFDSWFNKIFNH